MRRRWENGATCWFTVASRLACFSPSSCSLPVRYSPAIYSVAVAARQHLSTLSARPTQLKQQPSKLTGRVPAACSSLLRLLHGLSILHVVGKAVSFASTRPSVLNPMPVRSTSYLTPLLPALTKLDMNKG